MKQPLTNQNDHKERNQRFNGIAEINRVNTQFQRDSSSKLEELASQGQSVLQLKAAKSMVDSSPMVLKTRSYQRVANNLALGSERVTNVDAKVQEVPDSSVPIQAMFGSGRGNADRRGGEGGRGRGRVIPSSGVSRLGSTRKVVPAPSEPTAAAGAVGVPTVPVNHEQRDEIGAGGTVGVATGHEPLVAEDTVDVLDADGTAAGAGGVPESATAGEQRSASPMADSAVESGAAAAGAGSGAAAGAEMVSITLGAVRPMPAGAGDGVLEAHYAGRLMVHMVTGTLRSAPKAGREQNAWQHDIEGVFHGDGKGLLAASNSLIPRPDGSSKQKIYTAPFGLLTAAHDDEILVAGHQDLGTTEAKMTLTREMSLEAQRGVLRGAAERTHREDMVGRIEELNALPGAGVKWTKPNNEVVYNIKPENLIGLLINRKAIKDIAWRELGHNAKTRQENATRAVQEIQEFIQLKYEKLLPIYESDDGWKQVRPFR